MIVNKLALITGAEIPIPSLGLNFHVPTCKEIGLLGENDFFLGLGLLTFSKRILSQEDKERLKGVSDFDVLMLIINDKNMGPEQKRTWVCASNVLSLFFPACYPFLRKDCIVLKEYEGEAEHEIKSESFVEIRSIICQEYGFTDVEEQETPENESEMARRIREKIEEGRRRVAKQKAANSANETVFDRYLSITCIYLGIPLNVLSGCTTYQLLDMFQRAQLKDDFERVFRLRIAGATDVKDAEDWTKDVHSTA